MEISEIKNYWDSIKGKHPEFMKGFNSDGIANEMIQIGDKTGDGLLNSDEAKIAYKNVIRGVMQELVKDPTISAEIDGITIKFTSSSDLVIFDSIFDKMSEDDQVSIPFNEMWNILKTYHADFTSVYSSLITIYPNLKTEINKIFVSHGFYRETTQGNGNWDSDEPFRDENNNGVYDQSEYYIDYPVDGFKYDLGEAIGSASDSGRSTRRSGIAFPGHYIKVDDQVPTYNVEIVLYNHTIIKIPVPYMINEIQVQNEGGFIYIPMPPTTYNSEIIVEPDAVQFNNQLIITTNEFYDSYETAITQGFYEEHDFEVTGNMPPKPEKSITWIESTEPEPSPTPEPPPTPSPTPEPTPEPEQRGIPGFPVESLITGLAVAVLVLWFRQRTS
jgi:hypothetical protein